MTRKVPSFQGLYQSINKQDGRRTSLRCRTLSSLRVSTAVAIPCPVASRSAAPEHNIAVTAVGSISPARGCQTFVSFVLLATRSGKSHRRHHQPRRSASFHQTCCAFSYRIYCEARCISTQHTRKHTCGQRLLIHYVLSGTGV